MTSCITMQSMFTDMGKRFSIVNDQISSIKPILDIGAQVPYIYINKSLIPIP